MVLLEEYVNRHKLQFPVVIHPQTSPSSLLMRHVGNWRRSFPSPWVILRIDWVTHPQRPGHYIIRSHMPLPDASARRETFILHNEPQTCGYDSFEEFVMEYAKAMEDVMAVEGGMVAVHMACWQIFCHCFDGYLSKHAGTRLLHNIEMSMDPLLASEVQHQAKDRALEIIRTDHIPVWERWENQVLPMGKNHMNWLARLINNAGV